MTYEDFSYSTDREWDNAEAYELGAANPERPWICTDRDVWHANPFYRGPAVPHPDDEEAALYEAQQYIEVQDEIEAAGAMRGRFPSEYLIEPIEDWF